VNAVDKLELLSHITADQDVDPFDVFFDEECKINSNLLELFDFLLDGFEEAFELLQSSNMTKIAPVVELLCTIFSNLSSIKPIRDALVDPPIIWTLVKTLNACSVPQKDDSAIVKVAELIFLYFANIAESHSSRLRSVLMENEVKSCLTEAAAASYGRSASPYPCVEYLLNLC